MSFLIFKDILNYLVNSKKFKCHHDNFKNNPNSKNYQKLTKYLRKKINIYVKTSENISILICDDNQDVIFNSDFNDNINSYDNYLLKSIKYTNKYQQKATNNSEKYENSEIFKIKNKLEMSIYYSQKIGSSLTIGTNLTSSCKCHYRDLFHHQKCCICGAC